MAKLTYRSRDQRPAPKNRNQGFSLVVVLIFMLVIVMIGITGMQAAGLQERMAGHSRDRAIAFQAAEIGLRSGEKYALDLDPYDASDTCANAYCSLGNAPDAYSYNWTGAKSTDIPSASQNLLSNKLAAVPRYFVEYVSQVPKSGNKEGSPVFRVTAHAVGNNKTTSITVQSVFVPVN